MDRRTVDYAVTTEASTETVRRMFLEGWQPFHGVASSIDVSYILHVTQAWAKYEEQTERTHDGQ